MLKIATPQELQAEIRAIMAFIHHSEKPDRQVIVSKLNELADRVAARKRAPKVKLPKSIDPPSYTLKELQKAGLDTAVQSLSNPQSFIYKLNDKLRGNYGVSVPLAGSYQGKAFVQIDPKGLTGDSGDTEVPLVAYANANGTTTNIPLKKLKLYVWWEKRDKGYNIVLKVDTSKPNMDAEKKRLQDY